MVKFHIIALKCGECGSYNTSREDDGNAPINAAVAAAVVVQAAQNVVGLEPDEDNEDDMGEISDGGGSEGTIEDMINDDAVDNESVRSDLSLD